MKIATVIPLAKNLPQDTLSYFTSRDIAIGTLVQIPLRKKIIDGIVIDIEPISMTKSDIKSQTFQMKKIESVKGKPFFLDAYFSTIEELHKLYIAPRGILFKQLLPAIF